ncbi:hypothetical protein T492DRAFT_503639 [Pavlovales sp. CCMP2436]|nr:hypothetical protein T492DRAFT_503639 [Pavlovales sp. CCMP2436]
MDKAAQEAAAHKAAGNVAFTAGRMEEAITCYCAGISMCGESAECGDTGELLSLSLNLAQCFLSTSNWARAAECAEAALVVRSTAKGHFRLARALHKLGRDGEAAIHACKARELSPADPKIRELCNALPAPPAASAGAAGSACALPPSRLVGFVASHISSEAGMHTVR